MFNEEEFYYTLTPPLLLQDSVDEFLFQTRQGFCEHYAAAFAILMRAANIPTRIVTGYQGGTINPIDNYMVIRQRDAHAWTEVWLGTRGWVRVDPTSAVAPARIMEGIDSALPDSLITIPLGLQNNAIARDIWRRVRNTFDAFNNRWNLWVLGYNTKRQHMLLNRIGFGELDWQGLTLWLFLAVTLILLAISFLLFKQKTIDTDKARALYDKFCLRMTRLGIKRYAHEGPLDFANRAVLKRMDLAGKIQEITDLYAIVRYGGEKDSLGLLKQCVEAFKPIKILKFGHST